MLVRPETRSTVKFIPLTRTTSPLHVYLKSEILAAPMASTLCCAQRYSHSTPLGDAGLHPPHWLHDWLTRATGTWKKVLRYRKGEMDGECQSTDPPAYLFPPLPRGVNNKDLRLPTAGTYNMIQCLED